MVDKISRLHRSWLMGRIRGKNTKPEIVVRSLLHQLGYRFTVNGPRNRKLPGRPDIVLPRYNTVVFVHGCFWHRHPRCKLASTPSSNQDYWLPKFERNVQRDRDNQRTLRKLGWKVMVIWECELKKPDKVAARLINAMPREVHLEFPEPLEDEALVAEARSSYPKRKKKERGKSSGA